MKIEPDSFLGPVFLLYFCALIKIHIGIMPVSGILNFLIWNGLTVYCFNTPLFKR